MFDSRLYNLIALAVVVCAPGVLLGQEQPGSDNIQQAIYERVYENPNDATSWRLLGRMMLQNGRLQEAIAACEKALELAPESASVHFDLARALQANQDNVQAAYHYAEVVEIAKDSDYGVEAVTYLQALNNDSSVVPPRADLEPNRFAGTSFESASTQRYSALMDVGVAYNSNVQLAPIQRAALTTGLGGTQFFFSPQFEASLFPGSAWDAGFSLKGYFSFNESQLQEFNVEEYQPGTFIQRSLIAGEREIAFRAQYDFILDQFQGETFGRRHATTFSLNADSFSANSLVYWTIDYSDFTDDGLEPNQTSLDGWTNTLGASHTIYRDSAIVPVVTGGIDVQLANLRGSDFAYRGWFAYLESEMPLPMNLWLTTQLGGGYRNYPDFVGDPTRDEALWRASVELNKQLTDRCTLTAFSTYDRFGSPNELFDTSRFLSGIMTSIRW